MIAATLRTVSADTLPQRACLQRKSRKKVFSGIFKQDPATSLSDIQNARFAGLHLGRAQTTRGHLPARCAQAGWGETRRMQALRIGLNMNRQHAMDPRMKTPAMPQSPIRYQPARRVAA
jgi:hypothetical protein